MQGGEFRFFVPNTETGRKMAVVRVGVVVGGGGGAWFRGPHKTHTHPTQPHPVPFLLYIYSIPAAGPCNIHTAAILAEGVEGGGVPYRTVRLFN